MPKFANLDTLSENVDSEENMDWLNNFEHPPITGFIPLGAPGAANAPYYRIDHSKQNRDMPERLQAVEPQ